MLSKLRPVSIIGSRGVALATGWMLSLSSLAVIAATGLKPVSCSDMASIVATVTIIPNAAPRFLSCPEVILKSPFLVQKNYDFWLFLVKPTFLPV
jgi:hypothetical protein